MTTTSDYVYKTIDSPVGRLRLVASDKGLAGVWWADSNRPTRIRARGDSESGLIVVASRFPARLAAARFAN